MDTTKFFVKEMLVSAAWVACINAMRLVATSLPLFVELPPYVTGTTIALSWLFLLIAVFGWLKTNAFYSPSIATSFSFAGFLPFSSLPIALLAELLGSVVGIHALALFVTQYLGIHDATSVINVPALNTALSSSWIDGAIAEAAVMFFLCMAIFLTMSLGRFISPIIVGIVAVLLCMFGGKWTGPIMNPIAAFGPNYLTQQLDLTHFQVYWLGSIVGAALAGIVYRLFLRPPAKTAKAAKAEKSAKAAKAQKKTQQKSPQKQE